MLVAMGFLAGIAGSANAEGITTTSIRVAPSMLVKHKASGAFTVHTGVKYGPYSAYTAKVWIGGQPTGGITMRTYSDARGYLVAQCRTSDVISLVLPWGPRPADVQVTLQLSPTEESFEAEVVGGATISIRE
jgi:hypothetical protein